MAYRRAHYRRGHYRKNKNGGYTYVQGHMVGGHEFNKTGNAGNGGGHPFSGNHGHYKTGGVRNGNDHNTQPDLDEESIGCLIVLGVVVLIITVVWAFGSLLD